MQRPSAKRHELKADKQAKHHHMRMQPRMQVIEKNGQIYVQETVFLYRDGELIETSGPIDQGPMPNHEIASRWIGQRSLWWQGLQQHLARFGPDNPPDFREFVFDPSDTRNGIQCLLDMEARRGGQAIDPGALINPTQRK